MKTSYVGRNLEKMVSQWMDQVFFSLFIRLIQSAMLNGFLLVGNLCFYEFLFNKNIIIIILA